MARCRDCIHFNDCLSYGKTRYYGENSACNDVQERCKYFKDKADVVEVETIKAWLYKMAINNVGCAIDGDFSKACEEIISRLDGLRNFAKERSE